MNTRRIKPQSHAGAAAGFTLTELLAVMAILALLMGMGVGVFSRLNFSKYGAVGIVRNALRSARESAMASGLPVMVLCDPAEGKVYDLSVRPAGNWQFEDVHGSQDGAGTSEGALGMNAQLVGARAALPGRVGAALYCGKRGDHAAISLEPRFEYAFTDGVSLEMDIYVSKLANSTLALRGRQFRLAINSEGALEGEVGLAEEPGPAGKPAGVLLVSSPPGVIVEKEWIRVGLIYDRMILSIHAAGLTVGTKITKQREPVIRDKSPLWIGDKRDTYNGRIDGVRLGFISPGDGAALPKEVKFAFSGTPVMVRFLADGRLDPDWHPGSVSIGLVFPENIKKQITVGPYGTAR